MSATFGAGGHADLLAADLQGQGRFIGIDKDASVRPYFERFQRGASVQARFLRGDFAVILGQLADNGVEADAIHEQVAAHDICGTLAQDEPDQVDQIMFGAFTCLDLETRVARELFDVWGVDAA